MRGIYRSLVVVCCFLVHESHGFGSGAPPSTCDAMMPHHSGTPQQTSDIPYTLSSSPTVYVPGQIINVTLNGEQGKTHRGFLVVAQTTKGVTVGTMIPTVGQNQKTIACGNGGNGGITHSKENPKMSSEFKWRAPEKSLGDIIFKVTVVETYKKFWVGRELLTVEERQQSETTTKASRPQPTPPTTTTDATPKVTPTAQPQTSTFVSTNAGPKLTTPIQVENGLITFDPECGSSKGCFVKCDGESCDFMVTWRDLGNAIQFEIYGKPEQASPDAWVAIGFSSDTRMGEDSVTECVHTNGMVQAFNSYNPGYSNARLDNPQIGLAQIQGNYINGVLMCSFVRAKRVRNLPQLFDLEQDWHIMYANGKALSVPAWTITMHSLSPKNYPQTSAVRVDYQSYVVVGSGAKYPLVKAHGCLMIFAWVLFTGVGIVAARYYKNVWADKTFMKLKIWFQVHRFSMAAAVVCNALAFILIFIEVEGYSNLPDIPGKSYLRAHPVLGIIITILSLANPVMAFFRPGPEDSKRSIFNWAHWGIGMAAYILSTVCICFGFQLGKSHTPDYAIYIMIAYVIYIIIFDIGLEMMEVLARRQQKGKVEQVEMTNANANGNDSTIPNGNTQSKGKNKKTDRTKTILLAVHFAFTGTFALVLVLVVALN